MHMHGEVMSVTIAAIRNNDTALTVVKCDYEGHLRTKNTLEISTTTNYESWNLIM